MAADPRVRSVTGGDPIDDVVGRNIVPEPTPYTIAETAERSLLDAAAMERVVRAAGLRWPEADEAAFGDADVAFFDSFAFGSEMFGEEATLHFTRAMGISMARVGHAAVTLFLANTAEQLRDRPIEEQVAAYDLSGVAFNQLPQVLERLFRLHALRAIDRWRAQRHSGTRYDVQTLAVGFVDLVGFTEQTQVLEIDELADLVFRFEADANDTVVASGGEVVKLIGDEIMFVADSAADACRVASALDDVFAKADVTPRGGISLGPLFARGGDFYGPVVNVASRLAALAAPGEVLVTRAVRDALGPEDGIELEPAGRRMLKGFDDPVEAFALIREESG
jgi:adenylate cyclase